MKDDRPPPRFRIRLMTILLVVAILALLLEVAIQQAQIRRLRRSIDAYAKQQDQMATIIRELRDAIERHR